MIDFCLWPNLLIQSLEQVQFLGVMIRGLQTTNVGDNVLQIIFRSFFKKTWKFNAYIELFT